jgi:hydrogenase maturation factor
VGSFFETLGSYPLYFADERKIAIVITVNKAVTVRNIHKAKFLGKETEIIGEVIKKIKGKVCQSRNRVDGVYYYAYQ